MNSNALETFAAKDVTGGWESATLKIKSVRAIAAGNPEVLGLAHMILDLPIEITRRCRNMATDGRTVFANPDFVRWCSRYDLLTVLLHEAEHIARLHHVRMPTINGMSLGSAIASGGNLAKRANIIRDRYNRATDYSINGDLYRSGRRLVTWTDDDGQEFELLYHPEHSESLEMVEKIYRALLTEEKGGALEGGCEDEEQNGQSGGTRTGEGDKEGEEGADEGEGEGEQSSGDRGQENDEKGESPDKKKQGRGRGTDDDRDGEGEGEGGKKEGKKEGGQAQEEEGGGGGEGDDDGAGELDPRAPKNFAGLGEIWEAPDDIDREQEKREVMDRLADAVLMERVVGKKSGNHCHKIMEAHHLPDQLGILREFLKKTVCSETTWLRPSRRHLHRNLYLPGKLSGGGTCHFTIDASGSVSLRETKLFLGILRATCEELNIHTLKIAFVDSVVQTKNNGEVWQEINVRSGEDIYLDRMGGGGTSFDPIFHEIEKSGEEVQCLVYMTDGWGDVTVPDPGYPVVWVTTSRDPARRTFGELIDISRFKNWWPM